MKWTKDAPVIDGYYWQSLLHSDRSLRKTFLVYVDADNNIRWPGWGWIRDETLWYGPVEIEEPEPPKV
jgi:hypothetical protein